jgi:L,D-peptidoglycan transpeptidase YkuD (ErfK/YbiS/YcfS/YnhG family)
MTKTKKSWWIKERHNPNFDKPYYSACGQLSKREAKRKENSLYGFNIMLEYPTEEEYNKAIEQFKSDGYSVH